MFARLALVLALSALAQCAMGQGTVRDDFEGPETVLRAAGGDGRHQILLHERVETGAHSGRRCEHLQLNGAGSTAIYYSYPIQPARVIGELTCNLWVRADRPGLQIVARVVLPRSSHPETGAPLTTLIRGSDYRQVGNWQLLRVENLPRALEWHVRVLRSQFGPQVDPREAYVDKVLVNVYGGPGATSVWFDDLEVSGIVEPEAVSTGNRQLPVLAASGYSLNENTPAGGTMPEVEFKSRLLVGGQPFFPRIIEYRGEPLERLKKLGFNCVRVGGPAGPELLAEAARTQMWLIASPPPLEQLRVSQPPPTAPPGSGSAIGPQYDPVLAWDMGSQLSSRELEVARAWADAAQTADSRGRPILCGPASDLQSFTRPPFKAYFAERDVLGTTLELARYTQWLAERAQLAKAGSPMWATIASQASPELVTQMRLVSGTQVPPPIWHESQLRYAAHVALASRARGLCIISHSRLDAEDPATQMRAAMLELLNLELELIERWPAAGNFASAADTSDPHTSGAVIVTEHSRLLLPIYQPPRGQFVSGTQAAAQIAYTVAAVPEGDDAYELSPAGMRRLRSTRRAGGMSVVLGERSLDSLVVFTHDPQIIKRLREGLERTRARAVHLTRTLAAARMAEVDAVLSRIPQGAANASIVQSARNTVTADLQQAQALAQSDPLRSYDDARHALQVVRQVERVIWEQATSGAADLADPLMATFVTLPQRHVMLQQLAAAPRSPNRLPEGGCENLPAMLAAGWKHFQHQQTGIQSSVNLAPHAAHSGAGGLLLRAAPADEKFVPGAIETPPVWITTAPIAVEAGDLVQIQAWIKIDQPIVASADGLVVLDSHSGEALATRIDKTEGWRQITLLRAAVRSGPMSVTFALSGRGEAAVDDVTMQIVERGPLQQAQR